MDAVQRRAPARSRDSSTPASTGGRADRRDRAQDQRIQREERGARGGERAQVGPVAVVGDHQVPGRRPSERPGPPADRRATRIPASAGGIEGVAHRPEAETPAAFPRLRTRRASASSTAPASCRARRRHARGVGAHRGPSPAPSGRPAGRSRGDRRKRLDQLACVVQDGQLGGVGVHVMWRRARELRCSAAAQEITLGAVISATPEMSRQARQRRRQTQPPRAHTDY